MVRLRRCRRAHLLQLAGRSRRMGGTGIVDRPRTLGGALPRRGPPRVGAARRATLWTAAIASRPGRRPVAVGPSGAGRATRGATSGRVVRAAARAGVRSVLGRTVRSAPWAAGWSGAAGRPARSGPARAVVAWSAAARVAAIAGRGPSAAVSLCRRRRPRRIVGSGPDPEGSPIRCAAGAAIRSPARAAIRPVAGAAVGGTGTPAGVARRSSRPGATVALRPPGRPGPAGLPLPGPRAASRSSSRGGRRPLLSATAHLVPSPSLSVA